MAGDVFDTGTPSYRDQELYYRFLCRTSAEEVLVLADAQGAPELIVCAVPYLRDQDIPMVALGRLFTARGQTVPLFPPSSPKPR
ncbi:MAG: hypothetical protein LBT14_12680 [Treponema sp.]|nr:hypothetical protein [Treponema sp.]